MRASQSVEVKACRSQRESAAMTLPRSEIGKGEALTSRQVSKPIGTPSLAFHPFNQLLTLLFASSNTPSILSPANSNHGNTIVCNAAPPRRRVDGDQSEMALETLGRMS